MCLMMESSSSGSGSGYEPDDGQLTSTQVEVLELLRRLVHLVASDAMIDIRNQQEVRVKSPVKVGKRP